MRHQFQKTLGFQLGYFFYNAIICYGLKRPRFKRKAKTLNATHKLYFLTIMRHQFQKTLGFQLGYFFLQCNHLLWFEKASIQVKSKNIKRNSQIVFLDNYEASISKKHWVFSWVTFFLQCNHLLWFEKTSFQE